MAHFALKCNKTNYACLPACLPVNIVHKRLFDFGLIIAALNGTQMQHCL
jgi:hypothetical protein